MMKHPTNNEIWFAEQRDLAIEERDEQRARAEALAAELRELRENVMLGLGMTAAAVAAVDDELADSTIGYLLTGHKEMAAALRHMTVERNTISSSWDVLAAEVGRLTAELQNTTVDRDMALRYADVLKNERDALRAQLDAEGWRSVEDNSPAPLEPVVIDTYDGVDVGWRLPEVPHLWSTRRGRSYLTEEIRGVLAIPAPPQE